MGELTGAQRRELERLATLKMPASFERDGWPGFPQSCVDLRSIGALERLGYVEGGAHLFERLGEKRGGFWWRITDSGRAALSQGRR